MLANIAVSQAIWSDPSAVPPLYRSMVFKKKAACQDVVSLPALYPVKYFKIYPSQQQIQIAKAVVGNRIYPWTSILRKI